MKSLQYTFKYLFVYTFQFAAYYTLNLQVVICPGDTKCLVKSGVLVLRVLQQYSVTRFLTAAHQVAVRQHSCILLNYRVFQCSIR